MAKSKKYQKGGPVDEFGKPISAAEAKRRDEALTKSITGYKGYKSPYDIQKEETERMAAAAKKAADDKRRYGTPSAAVSTYVKKPIVKSIKKYGGSVTKSKKK